MTIKIKYFSFLQRGRVVHLVLWQSDARREQENTNVFLSDGAESPQVHK